MKTSRLLEVVSPLFVLVLVVLCPLDVDGAPKFSNWGTPENLGCVVNSEHDDGGVALSKNGLSLYFNSGRPDGSVGGNDIWVSQRASKDDPWGPPQNLGTVVNTSANEGAPSLSRDEHWLFFNSNRAGSSDIWVSWRPNVHDDFGWEAPVRLNDGLNSAQFEAGATYFENEGGHPLLFLGKGATALSSDIYVSEWLPDGTFGPALVVAELSSPQAEQRPSIRFDGLEMFFGRSITPSNFDLFVSTREDVLDAWDPPTNLGPGINSEGQEGQPHIAPDRLTLFFSSNRPGGCGDFGDIYVTTRTKLEGKNDD